MAYDTKRDAFYIAYNQTGNWLVVRFRTNGSVTPIATLPNMPTALAFDPVRDMLYSTDQAHFLIYSISQRGLVLPLAGGTQGTQDGQGATAQFQGPQGIVADPVDGNLFVDDVDRIRVVTRGGRVTTKTPPGGFGPNAQSGGSSNPEGIAFDPLDHTLFVTDPFQQKIWHIVSKTVHLVSGQCINHCEALQRDGALSYALFGGPFGVAFDPVARALYVADSQNKQVRLINAAGVSTLAGSGATGNLDGLGYKATFAGPTQGVLDAKTGEFVVLDNNNNELRFISTTGAPPPPPPHGITMYDPPSGGSSPGDIVLAPDNSVWFTEAAYNQVGRLMPGGTFVEYPGAAGSGQFGHMVMGSDGDLWYGAYGPSNAEIDRLAPDGTVTTFPIPGIFYNTITDMVLASDGNVWFCESSGPVGSITPAGVATLYPNFSASFIADGLGGTIWLSNWGTLEQITTSLGVLRQISLPIATGNMILGPDNNMWLAQTGSLIKVTKNAVLRYLLPLSRSNQQITVGDLTVGTDQGIWFTEDTASIGRLSTNGAFKDFLVPAPRSFATGIVGAPDGSIWFVDQGANKIGRYH